eukprot:EG_transcript_25074
MACDADGKVVVSDGAHYELREVKVENFQSTTHARKVLPINVWWELNKKKLMAQKPSDPKVFLTFRNQKWRDLSDAEKKKYETLAAQKNDPSVKDEDVQHELSEEEDVGASHAPSPALAPEKKPKEKQPRQEKDKGKDARPAKKQKVDKPAASAKLAAPKKQLTIPQKKAPAPPPAQQDDDSGEDFE